MYSTRGLTIPYSTLFLSVNNMRGHGLRIYYGGQRGNGIGGLFKPVLTRVAIPLAKRVAVPLAKKALRAVGKKVMNSAAKKAENWVQKKTTKKRKATQQRGSGLNKRRKLSKRGILTITKKV